MKKFLFCLICLVSEQSFAQTETYDIARYTIPQNMSKDQRKGGMAYSQINQEKGSFFVIILFESAAGSNDAIKDFKQQWAELAVSKHGADPDPKTESAITEDGWNTVTGASLIKQDSADAYFVLTVFSGYGKRLSVVSLLNDKADLNKLDSFLESIRLDKTKLPAQSVLTDKSISNPEGSSSSMKFGHMILWPPLGWNRTDYSNAVSFVPADLMNGYGLEMRVMESKSFTGTLTAAFEESWKDAVGQLQSASSEKPYSILIQNNSYRGWEYIRGEGTIRNSEGEDFYLNLFVIEVNGRMERIFIVSQLVHEKYGDRPCAYKENGQYGKSADNFLYGLQFDDVQVPAVSENGRLTGLYLGLKLDGQAYEANYVYFFKNGEVYFGTKLPSHGFDGLSSQAGRDQQVRYWGRYIMENGDGELMMPYGKIPVSTHGENLLLTTQNTRHEYVASGSLDGTVFNGTYYFAGDYGNKGTPEISFTADGKFIDRGAMDILNHTTMSYYDIAKQPGQGTYFVRDYTIHFDYSDGRKLDMAFIGMNYHKGEISPETLTLSFNNNLLQRR